MHFENAGPLMYSVFAAIGLAAAIILFRFMKHEESPGGIRFKYILPVIILGAIIGAKLPVIISYGIRPEMLWTGKSYYGALVGAFLAINIFKAALKVKASFGDRFVVPLCVSAGIGKIGCFMFGCCAGIPTDFFLKIKSHAGIFVHPAQIYEAAFQFCAAAFFLVLHRTGRAKGLHFLMYMVMYGLMRFFIEFIRTEPRILLGFTVYQWMSVFFVPVFAVMLAGRSKNVQTTA